MAMAQPKQQTITDKDIRNNKIVSENRNLAHSVEIHNPASQNQNINPIPENKQKLLHDIENAYNDNLISEEVYRKTKEKLGTPPQKTHSPPPKEDAKGAQNETQKPQHHEATKPHTSLAPENKIMTGSRVDSLQTKEKLKPIKDKIKIGIIPKKFYEKIKKKLGTRQQTQEPKKTETGPNPSETHTSQSGNIVLHPQEPEEKATCNPAAQSEEEINRHENREKVKRHLENIERNIHSMNSTLKQDTGFKSLHDQIKESEQSSSDIAEIEKAAYESRAIKELKKKEQTFSDDIKALDKIYKDDIISLDSYEEKKKQIEKKIVEIEDIILRTLEKEELDALKEKLESEIRAALTTGPFSVENDKYSEDIAALTRMYNLGMICEEEYLREKEKLNAKQGRRDAILSKIDAVFEEYKKELIDKIREDESKIKMTLKLNKEESSSSQHLQLGEESASLSSQQKESQGIIRKIKQLLGITHKAGSLTSDPVIDKIRTIKRSQPPRDAVIKCAFILKGLVEKELNIKDEQTYNELMLKLAESSIEPETRGMLIQFFEKASTGEYKDSMKKDEIPKLLDEAERLARLVGRKKEKERQQIKDNTPQNKPEFLEKIDSFFGV